MRKHLSNSKGQALVELAFVLPILLLIVMGIVEFGRIFNAYLIVTNASREGARYASVDSSDTEIYYAIENLTSTLDQSQISISISPNFSSRTSGNPVEVSIDYNIDIIAPVIGAIIPNPFTVSAKTTMRIE